MYSKAVVFKCLAQMLGSRKNTVYTENPVNGQWKPSPCKCGMKEHVISKGAYGSNFKLHWKQAEFSFVIRVVVILQNVGRIWKLKVQRNFT